MKNTAPKNISERYFIHAYKLNNGQFKIDWAERKTAVNQHATKWKLINSRDLAREISKNSLVTK